MLSQFFVRLREPELKKRVIKSNYEIGFESEIMVASHKFDDDKCLVFCSSFAQNISFFNSYLKWEENGEECE